MASTLTGACRAKNQNMNRLISRVKSRRKIPGKLQRIKTSAQEQQCSNGTSTKAYQCLHADRFHFHSNYGTAPVTNDGFTVSHTYYNNCVSGLNKLWWPKSACSPIDKQTDFVLQLHLTFQLQATPARCGLITQLHLSHFFDFFNTKHDRRASQHCHEGP